MSPNPPSSRLPTIAKSAAAVILLMAIGGGAAYLLAGKLAPKAPRGTDTGLSTATPSATAPQTCPASPPGPVPISIPPASASPLPHAVWVNDPLGVNLRAAASATSTKITTLGQGTQATADQQGVDASGGSWFHVTLGSQAGWLRADFVASTPIYAVSGDGWSLMMPVGKQLSGASAQQMATATTADDPVPFLTVVTGHPTDTLAPPAPAPLRHDIGWSDPQARLIQVWSYTVLEHLARAPIDLCVFPAAAARADHGWPYTTYVRVASPTRVVQFLFVSQRPNDPLVDQILNSVAMS